MKNKKLISLLTLGMSASVLLAACSSEGEEVSSGSVETAGDDFSVAMVTDTGGVDDKSFNQSAWEGLKAWGEENGKEKGLSGYDYFQSENESDFITHFATGANSGFDVMFGVGYLLKDAIQESANNYPDTKFAIIDDTIEGENTTSVLFYDNEAAFLAGVAAAKTTKTDHVAFVGGMESVVIDRFEAGFVAGVEHVNPDIEISVQYVGSFADAAQAKSIANGLYSNGADIIYQAAGNAGNGVFSEARDIVTADPSREVYVIGVDRDQEEEGKLEIDGEVRDLTLTSTVKGVGTAAQEIANKALNGEFPANETQFLGLADNGVSLTDGVLSEEALEAVREAEEAIINGEIEVPESPAE
ncbi:Membrane lipoprotein TmpC [Jeotgalibaca dankookensis]|uniref:Membrane lipoprotein TmpC n=1 Tax=Jeotgalibaca dankookensis TaxID=708126 RepID=A0A1S6IN88_9LACT|nr:BMP family protein [Jeotgalibaca dankookensis]AQS53007.1 Membrane lipoprotein TmpC [Jeotgalibaca dankookensis]